MHVGQQQAKSSLQLSRGDVAMDSPAATGIPFVLCIDDRPQALELRKSTLESHGFCVKLASSGYTAMKMLEETPVAAVLLEYKREGMDAEAVACHIKQRFPRLPIILLSAYSEMPERILWLVDEYVMKSEMPERLVRIIERAMRPPRLAPRSHERRQRKGAAA
jgi:DNA-binding NtrC family response regulator